MKALLLAAGLLFTVMPAIAQSADTLIRRKATLADMDALQQIYCWSQGDLLKYDLQGKQLALYSNKTLGKPSWLDVRNPFGIWLYFPDYQTLIGLDRTLNKQVELDLSADWENIQAIASSRDGRLWITGGSAQQILKIDRTGKIVLTGPELRNLNIRRRIFSMMELGNSLYLLEEHTGIHQFDLFGQFIQSLQMDDVSDMRSVSDQLLLRKADAWYIYDALSLQLIALEQPADAQSALIPTAEGWLLLGESAIRFIKTGE